MGRWQLALAGKGSIENLTASAQPAAWSQRVEAGRPWGKAAVEEMRRYSRIGITT
jgi:hypothetical protein